MSRLPLAAFLGFSAALPALAQSPGYNTYGAPGLIDMPAAVQMPDAELAFSSSYFKGNLRTGMTFQILPRVSGTVRHVTVDDLDGGSNLSARSFDLQFQLLEEGDRMPGLALGFRDFLGDGPHGAEYLVASKSLTRDIRVTAGIGWGRLGSRGGFDLGFGERDPVTSPAGRPQFGQYFRGDAAFFGGVEWQTPVKGLTLLAEYSSDAYTAEQAVGFDAKSPFNFGLRYKTQKIFTLDAYYLYGDTVGFQLTIAGNPRRPLAAPDFGRGPTPLLARPANAPMNTNWAGSANNRTKLVTAVSKVLAEDSIIVEEMRIGARQVDIFIVSGRSKRLPRAIGRTARVLAAAMPPSVEVFRITPVEGSLATTTVELKRSDLEAQVDRPGASLSAWQAAELSDAVGSLDGDGVYKRNDFRRFSWALNPSVPFSLFDPDSELDIDLQLNANARYRFTRGLSVSAEISKRLVGSEASAPPVPVSDVPVVRSDSGQYYAGDAVELERLTGDYVFKLSPAVYGRVSAGLLERMYAGVSGEVLWAPTDSNLAFGVEVNHARKRDPVKPFGLLDYGVTTGHASVYWDTGFHGIEAQLDAGRYLAGDWGATLTLSRRFANGWDVSAYVTRTSVSVEDFGEGSYAKGVTVTMPLRWGLPHETRSTASLSMADRARDGGARLGVAGRLYGRIRDADANSLEDQWSTFWQ